jgi:hypothetical protein
MSVADPILEIMGWILTGSPSLLVYLLGILIAVKRYRRHPTVSTLTLFSLVGLMFLSVLTPFVYRFIPGYLADLQTVVGIENAFRIVGFISSLLHAGLLFLLLLAVFSGRKQQLGIRGADGQYLPPDFLIGERQK